MLIIKTKDKNNWKSLILKQPFTPFTQSWEWGELQKNSVRKIWRLEFQEKNEIIGLAQIIKYPLPFNKNFLYIPRGPIILNKQNFSEQVFEQYLNKLAREENAIFIRIDSGVFKNAKPSPTLAYRSAITQPKTEWMIDLPLSESDLLAQMHEKTRYNIRLARKKGVAAKVYFGDDLGRQLEKFFNLLRETAQRDKFYLHPIIHYQKIFDVFRNKIELVAAEYEEKILAAGLVLFSGNTATYLYGGSSSENRNLMAPYAMHWQAIRRAKDRDCKWYSFGAVNDTDLASVARFKQGFGGEAIDFGGSFDMIINPLWYWLYNTARKFKK